MYNMGNINKRKTTVIRQNTDYASSWQNIFGYDMKNTRMNMTVV